MNTVWFPWDGKGAAGLALLFLPSKSLLVNPAWIVGRARGGLRFELEKLTGRGHATARSNLESKPLPPRPWKYQASEGLKAMGRTSLYRLPLPSSTQLFLRSVLKRALRNRAFRFPTRHLSECCFRTRWLILNPLCALTKLPLVSLLNKTSQRFVSTRSLEFSSIFQFPDTLELFAHAASLSPHRIISVLIPLGESGVFLTQSAQPELFPSETLCL